MHLDFFNLLYNYLEECQHENISQNVRRDAYYLKSTHQEHKLRSQYESLNLSNKQRTIILDRIDAILAQNEAYIAVVFHMAMQCCFALLLELADLK